MYIADNETQPLDMCGAHIIIASMNGLSIKSVIRLVSSNSEICTEEQEKAVVAKIRDLAHNLPT